MNIKILHWQKIKQIGGIGTWVINIREALKELGHTVELIHTSDNIRMKTYETDVIKRQGMILAGRFISLLEMKKLCDELNNSDLIIIAHPSPHPIKSQLNKPNNGRLWQLVYKNITTKKVVIFHDNMWQVTNEWLKEVATNIDYICCGQYLFTTSAKELLNFNKNIKINWLYHPIEIPKEPCLNERKNICVSGSQWIYWKRHKKLLEILPKLPIKIHFYNNGIWYYNLRYEPEFFNYISNRLLEMDAKLEEKAIFFGNVSLEKFYSALKESLCSIDYSKRGYINYTHWEPLLFGSISFIHEEAFNSPYCKLPNIDLVQTFNEDNLVAKMQKLLTKDNSQLNEQRIEAFNFCKNNLDRKIIANSLLNFVMEN